MTITTKRGFKPNEERYTYDFGDCNYKSGWAQVDTTQDASYFGTWANPITRQMFSYCEGDTCLTTAETDDEFVQIVRECIEWNQKNETWKGIDGMCQENIISRFNELGLGEYLH